MTSRTTLHLEPHYANFLEKEVASGRYKSASDVVQSALKLLEEEDAAQSRIDAALEAGERSPLFTNFDPEAHLALLKKSRF